MKKVFLSVLMQLKILVRNPLTLSLLFLIPAVFLGVVYLTSGPREIAFKLGSIKKVITAPELEINMVFMAAALVGFLAAFYSLVLVQRNRETYRRLMLAGFKLPALLLSFIITQALVVLALALYLTAILSFIFEPSHWFGAAFGFFLMDLVYASYATLVASLISGYLEGILVIVLLANIDAGWLQNPLFYAGAENQALIRYLPGFYPSQVTLIKVFSDYQISIPVLGSFIYAVIFMALALITYFFRLSPRRTTKLS